MDVFFDTEFTKFAEPKLISAGFCVASNPPRNFYVEVLDGWCLDDCSEFVREVVVPLLEGGSVRVSREDAGAKLRLWISGLAVESGEPITLVCDYLTDARLVMDLLSENLANDAAAIQGFNGFEIIPSPASVASLNDVMSNYAQPRPSHGLVLRRHHALDDAIFLMLSAQGRLRS